MKAMLTGLVIGAAIIGGGYVAARTARYDVTIGGGARYYSVIKLDRWTGRTWRLDNSGLFWREIQNEAGKPAGAR